MTDNAKMILIFKCLVEILGHKMGEINKAQMEV